MAPYGANLGQSVSEDDSSIGSSFFKNINSSDDDDMGTIGTIGKVGDNFSVQTPSVAAESAAGRSMESFAVQSSANSSAMKSSVFDDEVSVSTPSVVSDRSQSFRSTAPSIRSVETPSVHEDDEDLMDQSVFTSVINSVIHSIVGKNQTSTQRFNRNYEHPIIDEDDEDDEDDVSEVLEETYDEFMNEFTETSVDIIRKRSTGLIQVMSTLDQGDEEEEEEIEPLQTNNDTDLLINDEVVDKNYQRTVDDALVGSGWSKTSKSTRMSKRVSRSRLIPTGLKGLGRKGSRSMSPSPAKSKFISMLESRDDSTIGQISVDSFQSSIHPARNSRNKVSNVGVANITKTDLDQRRDLELLLSVKKYNEMFQLIKENPKLIGIQSNQPSGKTFLHVIAEMPTPPPETIILKVVAVDTSLVTVTDNNKNTPLHLASRNVRKGNMHAFTVLLKFHPMGASERNSDGDLPLHIVASRPSHGAEEAAHLLLETNPKAIIEPNNKGKIPLHLALSEGSKNLKLLLKIVKMHKFRKNNVDVLDNRGNSPLHCAIINGTKFDAIDLFNKEIRESYLTAYMKENEQGFIPLHLALTKFSVDPSIILSLINAAPFSAGTATPGGDMPVALASKAKMKPEIVKLLLASDLPIELGNKNGKAGMGSIVEREHGHSWWHVAVECQSTYVDVITSLLSDHATFVQIVALLRCLGPDGKTRTLDAITAPLEAGIRNLLRFYYRYEISMERMPVCSNEIQSFAAKDHGEELERRKVTGPWLNDGFTSIGEDGRKMKADDKPCEIEYVPWQNDSREVTLRCYAFDDAFDAEKRYRDQQNLSSKYCEDIVKIHKVSNYANASFTSGKLLCIAFEKNDVTLCELMDDDGSRAKTTWLVKCHLLLKDIATCLDHLHNESLIHGSLDPTVIGQFQSRWKLMYIGNSTKMGHAMGGSLRRCVPPESLSGTKPASIFSSQGIKAGKSSQNKKGMSASISRKSKSRASVSKLGGSVIPSSGKGSTKAGLPPLPEKAKNSRKKLGVFVFGFNDMGLGNYGRGRNQSKLCNNRKRSNSVESQRSVASSVDSYAASGNDVSNADEGSLRVIAMQEDEIARLRKALEEKEHIYRRQLIEERSEFKRQEIERQRELQKTKANMLQHAKDNLYRFAPEKVMASPAWDIWSFGLLMVELILGKTPLLPSFAVSDDEFVENLMMFGDTEVAAVREEIRENAGDLAADLVARLLHPNPLQRIETMAKVLQHKYFHEEVVLVEKKPIFGKQKNKKSSWKVKQSESKSMDFARGASRERGRAITSTSSKRSLSKKRGLK